MSPLATRIRPWERLAHWSACLLLGVVWAGMGWLASGDIETSAMLGGAAFGLAHLLGRL